MARLTLIVFPGGFNWPVWVAQARGFLAAAGVEVEVSLTPGSVYQWTALAEGRADVAITLMDNVVAYREGQGEAEVVVPDATAVMGFDNRALPALVAQPAIARYGDLRGTTLAVDAVKTGNALVLVGMLETAGLRRADYALARAGGVKQRFEAMLRGEFSAALFNAPYDGLLRLRGFPVLDAASVLLPRFQGHVVAVRRGWAEARESTLVAFLRALLDALAWLYDPRNRGEALRIYRQQMPEASAADAETAYSFLFDPVSGFPRDGEIDRDGVRAVLAFRARYGEPRRELADVSAYCDMRFLGAASAR
jgi:ABC-type nitrate/sulfonate/bicarbonate transport system substrate-binding protein